MISRKLKSISIIVLASLALVILAFSYFMRFSPKEAPEIDLSNRIPNDGEYISRYKNGEKKSVELYENGKKEGFWVYYHPSGHVKKELNYLNDKLHGVSKYYNQHGELIYAERYTSGVFSTLDVANDSLYKYEVEFLEYGTSLTKKHCKNCHNTDEPNHFKLLDELISGIDSLEINKFSLDTLHQLVTDSLLGEIDTTYSDWIPKSGEILFQKYDIEAIIHYIDAVNNKAAPLRFKRIRDIKKKPKVV